jgi:hypothetical protein
VALQGDLQSFALPDVLRLLAGTGKSGLLEVAGPSVEGELSLRDGAILRGGATSAPSADRPAEVVYELLRLVEGSFAFAEGDQHGDGPGTDVEVALAEAEALLAEWREVEAVVPGMDAWATLAAEAVGDEVRLDGDAWRSIVAIAGGGSVRDLAVARGLSDLDASRAIKGLVEAGLVEVRASHAEVAPSPDPYEAFDRFEPFDGGSSASDAMGAGDGPAMTELEDLVVEDRPVVMEDRDDALLPEPLPGEGVAYEGEEITGAVDGRTFDVVDHESAPHGALDVPAPHDVHGMEPGLADVDGIGGGFGELGGADPFSPVEADGFASATSADLGNGEGDERALDALDDERGSLLRFLSSVKP